MNISLDSIMQLLLTYRYAVLFPLAAIEGPIVSFIVGFLISLGYFNPFVAYIILIFGDFIPDSLLYMFGKHAARKSFIDRYGKRFGITERHFNVIARLWHEHSLKTMFFSKLAYGLSTPFLISAGLAHMPSRKFYTAAIPITMFQYAVLMTLGYYFGNSYTIFGKYLQNAEIIIAVVVVAVIVGYYAFSVSLREKIIHNDYKE